MNRRGFLSAAAATPIAAPMALRQASEAMQAKQLAIGRLGGIGASSQAEACNPPSSILPGDIARKVFADPEALAAVRSQLFADHRHINSIDPDLHVLRAMSPMAKITFQRQREVERVMQDMTARSYIRNAWGLVQNFYEKLR